MDAVARVEVEVYASYRQFYVVAASAAAHGGELWDGAALERHIGAAPGIVGVGTAAYDVVPVTLEVWETEPPLDLDGWDHVAEASLAVPDGLIAIATVEGPLDELEPLEVKPGTQRVRVAWSALAEADESGGDAYRVQIWPAGPAEPVVLKTWPPWDPARAEPRPTASGGRLLVGADAEDARRAMHWLASRGQAHLFVDDDDVLWEHSNLPDAVGTPQLEELTAHEAEARYGRRSGWEQASLDPTARGLLRSLWRRR